MEVLCIVFVVLGILLAGMTLVGHGIWVALAWLFGGGTTSTRRESGRGAAGCPRCH